MILTNLNSQLDLKWEVIRQDDAAFIFNAISHTSQEKIILLTSTKSDGDFEGAFGNRDAYVARYSMQGLFIDDFVIGGNNIDNLNSMAATSDGGILLAGSTDSQWENGNIGTLPGSWGSQSILVKLGSSGAIEFLKGGGWNRNIVSVKVDNQDNIYTSDAFGNQNMGRITLSKYDIQGDKLWEDPLEIGNGLTNTDVAFDQFGNVFRLSNISTGVNESKVAIFKFDSDGNEIWRKLYGSSGFNIGNVIEVQGDKLILAGRTNSSAGDFIAEYGDFDAFLAFIDLEGILSSYSVLGGSEYESIDDMEVMGDKIFISGQSYP